ncbi:glycosyl transferase [Subtercola boreus]|uniref:Glycosyl transferase n=1 Tax=Subtercola boreus TaxID=120213 RepID=A0A3E0VTF2_9MICO|nr:glycosyl transferase [Subtercola boreus]RFA13011.1 glycosyl transferase [Subtercola boreus]
MKNSFIVQQSFPVPRPTTNPYLVMLAQSIDSIAGVSVRNFSWRGALFGRYDVFHVHWPEILVSGHSPLKALARQGLTALLLLRLRMTRTPIVRTLHNLELPSGISRRERALLRQFERQTTLWIRLNPETPVRDDPEYALIPHGHYRDWFEHYPVAEPEPGRIAYFGLIRRYKGVDALIDAFRALPGDVTLQVSGRPSTPELADDLRRRAAGDERIGLTLQFLDDAELVQTVSRASLVVLPYTEMHNSGGALTALSLNRPVLLPANPVNQRLAAEVGFGWVHQYTGELTATVLAETLRQVENHRPVEPPRLGARDWRDAGLRHYSAYLAASQAVTRRQLEHAGG